MFFNDISIIWVGKFSYEPELHINKHSHPFYHIVYIADGHGYAIVAGEYYQLSKGCLIFCPPGCEHEFRADDKEHLKTIEIKFDIYNAKIQTTLQNLLKVFQVKSSNVRIFFESAVDDIIKQEYLYKDFLAVHVCTILLTLLKQQHTNTCNDHSVPNPLLSNDQYKSVDFKKILNYIDKHLHTSITLNDLSTQVGYNAAYLCRIFKEQFGVSPMQYINNSRLTKAKELIMYSDLNITQIAQFVGFQSIHYFSKFFKKKEGVTPMEYKKKIRNNLSKWVFRE